MNPTRKKRLIIILTILFGAALTTTFVMMALQENLNAFFTPLDIKQGKANPERVIRAGGLVVNGSVQREAGELLVKFVITDSHALLPIHFEGILPDLFREGQGVIAIGKLKDYGTDSMYLQADEVLAKHDENYMSPELKQAMEEKGVHIKDGSDTKDSGENYINSYGE